MPVRMRRPGVGIEEKEVLELEQAIGARLPKDFRRFLLYFNGGKPQPNEFEIPGENNSDGITKFFNVWEIETDKREMTGRMPAPAAPIADAECGNLVCLVLGERAGIYHWEHEFETDDDEPPTWENMHFLAATFTEFWESLECSDPDEVLLTPGQVKSVWIAPGFPEELEKERS